MLEVNVFSVLQTYDISFTEQIVGKIFFILHFERRELQLHCFRIKFCKESVRQNIIRKLVLQIGNGKPPPGETPGRENSERKNSDGQEVVSLLRPRERENP